MPMEEYETPKLPTLEAGKSELLKKIPSRWRNKAMIAVVSGILGAMPLMGCSVSQNNHFTRYDCGKGDWRISNFAYDLCVRVHFGGAVGTPIYVAYLTEQEAFEVIKERLEEAGFNFSAIPPFYYVDTYPQDATLDLFDEERSVGIAHINWTDSNLPHSACGRDYSRQIAEQFAEQTNDITFGVFNTPRTVLGRSNSVTALGANVIRAALFEDLNEQIEDFIAQLQEEGIID